MRDRIPTYPGRIKLTPVPGQANKYDMVMADEPTQEGDAPVKKNLLSDATAALYGLTPDAVPDDVLAKLAFTVRHYWQKKIGINQISYSALEDQLATTGTSNTFSLNIYYTDSYSIDPITGVVTHGDLTVLNVSYNSYAGLQALRGKFWNRSLDLNEWISGSGVRYSPENAAFRRTSSGGSYETYIEAKDIIISKTSENTIVYAPNENDYPVPHGVFEGNTYISLGTLEDLALSSKFIVGSYTGTGSSTTQTIELGFVPALLLVFPRGFYNNAVPVATTPTIEHGSVPLVGTAFQVKHSYNDPNGNLSPYHYIAWRQL